MRRLLRAIRALLLRQLTTDVAGRIACPRAVDETYLIKRSAERRLYRAGRSVRSP